MTDHPQAPQRPPRRRSLRVMFFVFIPILAISMLAATASVGIRRAGIDVKDWHVDPTSAPPTGNPNWYRLTPDSAPADRDQERDASAPVFDVPVADLAAAFDAVAIADDRVEVLAGSAAAGFVTYVQRSAFFAFPDFVSVTFTDVPSGGSSLALFSRSKYGQSDLGVNKKRVERWIEELEARLA